MNKEELRFILEEGEGLKIEFKESLNNIDKEMVAFANAEGGRIFLGITDTGKIKGIEVTNKLKSQIQDIAKKCDPSTDISFQKFENVLVITVDEGKDKPYKCSSGFYMRQGPNSQKMEKDDIRDLILSSGKGLFDEQTIKDFDFMDMDDKALKDYLEKAGIKSKADKKTILFNMGVVDNKGRLNHAGLLFFSEKPKKYLINAYVSCVIYAGEEKVNVLDRIDIESNLVGQVEESIKFIRRNTRTGYKIKDIQREEIPEYPLGALREAILNAVMHRDYFEKGANVQIDIFDNRIEISNIGALIPPLNKANLGRIAVRRNPLIADLFHRIRFVEKIGTGLKRIKEECNKYGNVKFDVETNGYFIATFRLLHKVGEKVGEQLTENQKKVIQFIITNPSISAADLSTRVGISSRKIEENILKLKQKGLLKRIGPDKGGHWGVVK